MITSASFPECRATTSTTARRITLLAAAFCWRSRARSRRSRSSPSARSISPPSRRKSRVCAAPSFSASIRRFRRRTFRSDLIARAFASVAQQPKRSIYFASVTAEEQGLRGSEFLGKHPPVSAKNISLDLNYDDVPPLGVPEEVNVAGAERTTFYPTVESTAKDFGLKIVPDSQPGAGHYYRSDHFSFARAGVPAFSIDEGVKYQG